MAVNVRKIRTVITAALVAQDSQVVCASLRREKLSANLILARTKELVPLLLKANTNANVVQDGQERIVRPTSTNAFVILAEMEEFASTG